ncbi:MAG: polyphosphate kinase 1, partial [Pedosphaera sp.]|nr:polyphosphate kinase 1 [Pedosphaera sp.]MSS99989.1 polyphosphate kinase 1 [Pedosphaera sp.]
SSLDGRTASETFRALTRRIHRMVDDHYRCWREHLAPSLTESGFHFHRVEELSAEDRAWAAQFYLAKVRPVLTPLAIDPAHPFPQVLNKSLNLIVRLVIERDGEMERRLAIVQVPRSLPRLIPLPRPELAHDYLFLGQLIGHFIADIFPGTRIEGCWHFRVTRNGDLYLDEGDVDNLLIAVEKELRNRRRGDAVRLEIEHTAPADLRAQLLEILNLTEDDLYLIDGPISPSQVNQLCVGDHSPELRDAPFIGHTAPAFRGRDDIFAVIRERDVLLHHPYESFETVVDFLNQAADDPHVLAIKQTLYRTGGDRRIIGALMRAAEKGKQVAAVVELKARFDEANNIQWARELEEAGVHVAYGLVGYKIHAKLCLVVRQDEDGIRRYLHVGTGNYNPATARTYTDLSYLTAKPDYGEDAGTLFNLLTGFSQFQSMRKFVVAPFEFHERILTSIRRETANARKQKPARLVAKMNSLVDGEVIDALYEASQAGVKVDLVVRGICCLRPGIEGLSENIRVRSIVDRFLEHSRLFYFENDGQHDFLMGSGDWMYRNFLNRIEVAIPLEEPAFRKRLLDEILGLHLADNVKARLLQSDGSYIRVPCVEGEKPCRSQSEFIELASHNRTERAKSAGKKRPRSVKLQVRKR